MPETTITIVYDNTTTRPDLIADWGFACVIESAGRSVLFDTGQHGDILMANMAALEVDVDRIDAVVISHGHYDHAGGLDAFLDRRPVPVYMPTSCPDPARAREVHHMAGPRTLWPGIHTTGELGDFEQSLAIETDTGLAVIVGCSHPGVGLILDTAATFGKVTSLVGGLHSFADLDRLAGLSLVCPTHCTRHTAEIQARFPKICHPGGAGTVLVP